MTECAKVDVVGVGLNATDTVIPVEKFPEPGSKVEYSRRTVLPGGQVATTVVACQTWGLRTRYVGKLGDDDAARLHKDAFRRVGAEAQIVTVPGSHSLHNVILIDARGERTVICQSNEHMVLQPGEHAPRVDHERPRPSRRWPRHRRSHACRKLGASGRHSRRRRSR